MKNFDQYLSNNLGIPLEEVASFEKFYNYKKVTKNKLLLREGETCNCIFFVEKGLVRMYSIDKIGKEHVIQFAPENWLVADRSNLYQDEKSKYNIETIENSEIIQLGNDFFVNLYTQYPNIIKKNETLLHRHIYNLQNRIKSLLGDSAEQRYLDFITMYPDVMLRVPQWMVASYLGVTPESLSRVRKELSKKNFKPG